jgi:tetratricopeptide (TPR) repeat protein
MRTLIGAVAVAAVMLPALSSSAPPVEAFPPVENELLQRCEGHINSTCLADIAWSLAREEKRGFNLGQLAPQFARLRQWSRADELLRKIPSESDASSNLPLKYVAGERLAVALSMGNVDPLKSVQDSFVLSITASRLLGYSPRENVVSSDGFGKRLNEGLWLSTLKASRSTKLALLNHWERVANRSADDLKLANNFLILNEAGRARRVADRIVLKPNDVGRDLVELWLGLGEPRRAFEVIKDFDPRDRGLYKILVAKSLSKTGKAQEASAMALEAANDSFDASDYERLLMTVELLVEMNRLDLAKQITAKADQQSEGQGPFRPFNISAVGEMYGWTGDLQACLRLQAKALGVASTKGEVIAWGLVSGPIGYSSNGMFNLGPELRQDAAARSIRCGDRGAMKEIDNRRLARNYCHYYRRGLVKPEYLEQRPQKRIDSDAPRSLLFEHAAECHFELGETEVASSLLQRLVEDAKSSADFHAAYSAAELACVYGPRQVCRETLGVAGDVLIRSVQSRKLSAQQVVEFAAVWQDRGTER